jgi:hypothetical protein
VPSPRLAAAYILANTRPGAIIVLHEGGGRGRRTVEVLRRVLPVLSARGYRVVTLSELDALGRTAASPAGIGVRSFQVGVAADRRSRREALSRLPLLPRYLRDD